MKLKKWNILIGVLFSLILTGFWIVALLGDSHYKIDFFLMMFVLWFLIFLQDKIKLHPIHLFLFGIFLVLHDLGIFGSYGWEILSIEYDIWVHSYFGLISSLVLFRAYTQVGPYKGWFVYLVIIVIVLGLSAFHELYEFAGALVLGEGEGVLFVGAGDLDEWDTQKDMFYNLVGGVIGLISYWFVLLSIKKSK